MPVDFLSKMGNRLRGHIDRFDSTIAGWVFDPDHPTVPIEIVVEHEGSELFRCVADLFRGDLVKAFGHGNHGFSFDPGAVLGFDRNLVLFVYAVSATDKVLLRGGAWTYERLVHQGKAGWLFLNNDSNRVNLRLSAQVDTDESLINETAALFVTRQATMAHLQVPYRALIVPEKNVVCSAFWPELVISDNRPVPLILRAAETLGCAPIYPLDEFSQDPDGYFVKTDTHASAKGYELIFSLLRKELPEFFSHTRALCACPNENFIGNLGDKLVPSRSEKVQEYRMPAEADFYCRLNDIPAVMGQGGTLRGQIVLIENTAVKRKRLCVFGTSTAYHALPLLASAFSETMLVWENTFDYRVISEFNPDCVIWLASERFLPTFCNDMHGLPETLKKLRSLGISSGKTFEKSI